MARKCIFCGKKPENENKEHIIPQWLIKLTGEKNRELYLGPDYSSNELAYRSFSAKSLRFPSCYSCNLEYSDLEGRVKIIIENILKDNKINGNELDDLFNWIEKIRIGLWLAYLMLDKNPFDLEPNYYINNRVCKTDRTVYIFRSNESQSGIAFYGVQKPLFIMSPVCYSFTVNNYTFLNISTDFLTSRRLGFPYPTQLNFTNKIGKFMIDDLNPGLCRCLKPIINKGIVGYNLSISQSIYIKFVDDDHYKDDYVKKHSLDRGCSQFYIESDCYKDWTRKGMIIDIGESKYDSNSILFPKIGKYVNKILGKLTDEIKYNGLSVDIKKGYKENIAYYKRLQRKSGTYEKLAFELFMNKSR